MSQKQFDFSKPDVGGGDHPARRVTDAKKATKLTPIPGKPGFFVSADGKWSYDPGQNPNHYPKAAK